MRNFKHFKYPFFFLIVFSCGFKADTTSKESYLMEQILLTLNKKHFDPETIDNDFSEKAYKLYLERLDPYKRYFTSKDISKLTKFEAKIDDQVKSGKLEMLDLATEMHKSRVTEIQEYFQEVLKKPFKYDRSESFETDEEKVDWSSNSKELKDRWRKLLKLQTIQKIHTKQEDQEKAKEKSDTVTIKSFDEIEKEARERVLKDMNKWAKRYFEMDRTENLSVYLNCLSNAYDPHSSYFPPEDKEDFNIRMSGKLEGIGARLQESGEYIKVTEIVPGSPSSKQGELEPEDLILKVAQGSEEPVDIVDMPLDKAVWLIRGKKGTEVRLTVKKPDGSLKVVPIIRDVIKIEETFAKSAILNKGNNRIGYIKLPKFYADFQNPNGRRCAKDVAIEIEKLKTENVQGIILDLRGNGGGSLSDVVDMGGLFIDKGPIVQVKDRELGSKELNDKNPEIQYNGPLVVMINSMSASASEIMAAAMQDYGRAIIIGSEASFGKGTVQRFFSLDQIFGGFGNYGELGDLKVTIQKFYRINGKSTQLEGVRPDIILPDQYGYIEIGEKSHDYPMQCDKIEPSVYQKWKTDYNLNEVVRLSEDRIASNETFKKIEERVNTLKTEREKTLEPLSFEDYSAEQKRLKEINEKYKDMLTKIDGFEVDNLQYDMAKINSDSIKIKSNEKWIDDLEKDPYLYEAVSVMEDIK